MNNEPIAPSDPDPERWVGRNETDEDDDEYDVHSDPEDLSIQTESSESSSDSDPDFYTWNSESSGSEVGSTEALEIFENMAEVRTFLQYQSNADVLLTFCDRTTMENFQKTWLSIQTHDHSFEN